MRGAAITLSYNRPGLEVVKEREGPKWPCLNRPLGRYKSLYLATPTVWNPNTVCHRDVKGHAAAEDGGGTPFKRDLLWQKSFGVKFPGHRNFSASLLMQLRIETAGRDSRKAHAERHAAIGTTLLPYLGRLQ